MAARPKAQSRRKQKIKRKAKTIMVHYLPVGTELLGTSSHVFFVFL